MNIAQKHINEKFTQDSDPIKDLGIGVFIKRDFTTHEKLCNFVLKMLPAILKTSKIPDDIVFLPKYKVGAFKWKYYFKINDYVNRYLSVNNQNVWFNEIFQTNKGSNQISICEYIWKKLLEKGYPKIHQTKNIK